ncbi:MAG: hypothetical protein JRI44_06800 [Deltaproteobacteria bacterium]|nr:hypothetical protein [Deltaproteobacteria bacterium]
MKIVIKLYLILILSLLGLNSNIFAKDITKKDIINGLLSSFSIPFKEEIHLDEEIKLKSLFKGISGNISFNLPLERKKPIERQGTTSEGERGNNLNLSFSLKYNIIGYWFINTTFYKYLSPEYQAPWDPDFSYTFGYDDWHPFTLSLIYSNYGGNRLKPKKSKGERLTRFEEGTFSLGWKFILPKKIENLFVVHKTGALGGKISFNLTPRYMDLASLDKKRWKQSISLSIRYNIYKWWYANITFYYYPNHKQQQPWDPDFTYGFGYFDWHPYTISIQYNNYSGNRFPWRKRGHKTGMFKNGSISIFWSWAW